MDNFTKVVTGWVKQYFEQQEDGTFVCTSQEFIAGDNIEYEDDFQEPIACQIHQYQSYDMEQPGPAITPGILVAIERGKAKVKATPVPSGFRTKSTWMELEVIYDVINRTGLAIRDEIECMKERG